jgi:hypothetical protein
MKKYSLLFWCVFLCAGILLSQEFRATISGHVLDPSGAGVPGAAVSVSNVDTNIKTDATTGADGTYTVPYLRPGNYTLTVDASGFKKYVQSGIILEVAQKAGIDIALEVGAQTQSVEVTAATQLLETESANRGTDLNTQTVQELPLNFRNPYSLMASTPGVQFRGNLTWQRPFDGGSVVAFSMNGGLTGYNEVLIDGAPNTAFGDSGGSAAGYVPTVDSVSEVKVQTSTYDAQFGRTTGGVANVAIKAGTNQLHGAAYEFYRRTWLDANTFANNSRRAAKTTHLLDQPGVQLDGPVYIPKVYNGKNRTFFNFSYEKIHEKAPAAIVQSAGAPEFLTGDFSKLTTATGSLTAIFDPTTGHADASAPNGWVRNPFPNNRIPASQISPVSVNILKYMPAPNCTTPNTGYSFSNWCNSANADEDKYYNYLSKVDHNINDSNHVFFRFSGYNRSEFRPFNGILGVAASGQQPYHRINNSAAGDWVATLTPTMVFNLRASYTRVIEAGNADVNSGFDMAGKLGFPSSLISSLPSARNFGVYTPSGYMQLGRGGVKNVDNDYAVTGSITKIWNKHTIHTGFDIRQFNYLYQNDSSNSSGTDGVFNIGSGTGFTSQYWNNSNNTGNGYAEFLLGDVNGSIQLRPFIWMRQYYGALYLQDDWKVTQRLTLNLGLRWDANMAPTEKYDRLNIGLDRTTTSPLAALVDKSLLPYGNANLKGGMLFANTNGNSRGAYNSDLSKVAPRVGFAYRLTDKLVLRGGYGMYYFNLNMFSYRNFNGYSQGTSLTTSNDGGKTPRTLANGGYIADPFPTGFTPPSGNSLGLNTFVGQSFNVPYRNVSTPRTDQISLGLQYSVSKSSVVEVTYGGSRGYNLSMTSYYNLPSADLRKQCSYLDGGLPSFCDTQITNPFRSLAPFLTSGSSWYTGTTLSRWQLMRPFPQINGDGSIVNTTMGRSWYNSGQVNYRYRTRSGLTVNAGYTFSKWLTRTGYDDNITGKLQTRLSGDDQRHVLKILGNYELPFGKGKKFLGGSGGVVNHIAGGWEINSTFQSASGAPVNLPTTAIPLKKTIVSSVNWKQQIARVWDACTIQINANGTQTLLRPQVCGTDPAAYSWILLPGYTTAQQSPSFSNIRMPRLTFMDASLNKSFTIRERLRAQFRIEGFNVLNHTLFGGNVNTSATDANGNFGSWQPANNTQGYPRQFQLGLKIAW